MLHSYSIYVIHVFFYVIYNSIICDICTFDTTLTYWKHNVLITLTNVTKTNAKFFLNYFIVGINVMPPDVFCDGNHGL